jgi:hypothetical protein
MQEPAVTLTATAYETATKQTASILPLRWKGGEPICATAIVNACDTLQEAEKAADELAVRLTESVRSYWTAGHPH